MSAPAVERAPDLGKVGARHLSPPQLRHFVPQDPRVNDVRRDVEVAPESVGDGAPVMPAPA